MPTRKTQINNLKKKAIAEIKRRKLNAQKEYIKKYTDKDNAGKEYTFKEVTTALAEYVNKITELDAQAEKLIGN